MAILDRNIHMGNCENHLMTLCLENTTKIYQNRDRSNHAGLRYITYPI